MQDETVNNNSSGEYGRYYWEENKLEFVKHASLKTHKEVIKSVFKTGFCSTNSELHIIRHELGHALWNFIIKNSEKNKDKSLIRKRKKLEKLYKFYNYQLGKHKLKVSNKVSEYASYSIEEMIAECYAMYLNGTSNKFANSVMSVVLSNKGIYYD